MEAWDTTREIFHFCMTAFEIVVGLSSPPWGQECRVMPSSPYPAWSDFTLALFIDYMILHVENPNNSTKTLLETISELSKVSGYIMTIEKSVAFPHTNNKAPEKTQGVTIFLGIPTPALVLGSHFKSVFLRALRVP